MYNNLYSLQIHPSIQPFSVLLYPEQAQEEPQIYPRGHGSQGEGHPGQGANPLQDTLHQKHTHTLIYTLKANQR